MGQHSNDIIHSYPRLFTEMILMMEKSVKIKTPLFDGLDL